MRTMHGGISFQTLSHVHDSFAGAFGYYDVEDDLVEVAKRCMFTHVDKFALGNVKVSNWFECNSHPCTEYK